MLRRTLLVAAAALPATAPTSVVAAPNRPAPVPPGRNLAAGGSTSFNWAGYAAAGGRRYTSVSASWTQRAVRCAGSGSSYSSFWVGLDGFRSGTVEQTGTAAECRSGRPVYYAWYEMYPAAPKQIGTSLPGDQMTGSVTTDGHGHFTLTLANATRGWRKVVHATLSSAKLSSAEVIAEAPASAATGAVLPLADFGTVGFRNARANGSALGASGPTRLTMVTQGGTVKGSTSALTGGSAFTVTWRHS